MFSVSKFLSIFSAFSLDSSKKRPREDPEPLETALKAAVIQPVEVSRPNLQPDELAANNGDFFHGLYTTDNTEVTYSLGACIRARTELPEQRHQFKSLASRALEQHASQQPQCTLGLQAAHVPVLHSHAFQPTRLNFEHHTPQRGMQASHPQQARHPQPQFLQQATDAMRDLNKGPDALVPPPSLSLEEYHRNVRRVLRAVRARDFSFSQAAADQPASPPTPVECVDLTTDPQLQARLDEAKAKVQLLGATLGRTHPASHAGALHAAWSSQTHRAQDPPVPQADQFSSHVLGQQAERAGSALQGQQGSPENRANQRSTAGGALARQAPLTPPPAGGAAASPAGLPPEPQAGPAPLAAGSVQAWPPGGVSAQASPAAHARARLVAQRSKHEHMDDVLARAQAGLQHLDGLGRGAPPRAGQAVQAVPSATARQVAPAAVCAAAAGAAAGAGAGPGRASPAHVSAVGARAEGAAAAMVAAVQAAAQARAVQARAPVQLHAASGAKARPVPGASAQKVKPQPEVIELDTSEESSAEEDGKSVGEEEQKEEQGRAVVVRQVDWADTAAWDKVFSGPPGEVLVRYNPVRLLDVEIPRSKLQCMAPRTWLNDEVINLYMLLLQERNSRAAAGPPISKAQLPRCHFWSSFFCNKLFQDKRAYSYTDVRRWTSPNRLEQGFVHPLPAGVKSLVQEGYLDYIVCPVHQTMHWTLAVVDLRTHALWYLDSLGGRDDTLMQCLQQWVADEAKDKLGQVVDTSSWPIHYPRVPRQNNSCDCGVFAIQFASSVGSLGMDVGAWGWGQDDMPFFRARVLRELLDLRVM